MLNSKLKRLLIILAGAILATLLTAVIFIYQRDIQQARARIATGSQLVETNCGQIEYASVGNGMPILVVHGAGGGFDQGMDASAALIQNGFRVIAMSRFGYLRTPLPDNASAASQADAHACLLDALKIRRAAIIGASAGAPSSMQFALRHPERTAALVLLVPATFVPRPDDTPPMHIPAVFKFMFVTVLKSDFLFWAAPRLARQTMIRTILATPPEVVDSASVDERTRIQQVLDHTLPVSQRRLGLSNDATIISNLPRYPLESITAPTLILSMADDLYGTYDGARYSAVHIPNARLISYPSGGHLWVGRQSELMAEIIAFLQKQKFK